jgi:hypothetical protein
MNEETYQHDLDTFYDMDLEDCPRYLYQIIKRCTDNFSKEELLLSFAALKSFDSKILPELADLFKG